MRVESKSRGFTLIETMITMTVIGVIAVMMIQMVFVNSQTANGLARAKELAQNIQQAATTLANNNPALTIPSGTQIGNLTNFVSSTTDPTIITGFTAASPLNCNTANWLCYRYSNEGVILTSSAPRNTDGLTLFVVDPDGRGPNKPVVLVYNHDTGRLTTKDAYETDPSATTLAITPNAQAIPDPDYVKDWSKL